MTSKLIHQKKTSCKISMSKLLYIFSIITLTFSNPISAQLAPAPGRDSAERNNPIEPFHIIDNVYYVGKTLHNPSYLFTNDDGHILIDTTFEEYVPDIQANIEKLGFNVRDIKIILSSHAHHDHVGGHALMKEVTGATMLAHEADAEIIETGGVADFREGDPWHETKVDRFIGDQEEIKLGDTILTAHYTPGHTKGCTTWSAVVEDEGKKYDLVLICGLRMDGNSPLVGNPKYPEMPQAFAYSFAVAKTLPVDVFLGAHGYWFNLAKKIEMLKNNPEVNPFIDPEGYYRIIDGWERAYLERLKKER
ncbi:MAG: metallo-beta-lactamase class B [Gammaproteobacteria bacterium]|jgi:metallo-beta-lactamase class B